MRRLPSAIAVLIALISLPAWAHHSYALFDSSRMVTLSGTISKLQWTNPHVEIYFDRKDANGRTENWRIEMESPRLLEQHGFTRDALKVGLEIKLTGVLATDHTHAVRPFEVKLPSGLRWVALGGSHP